MAKVAISTHILNTSLGRPAAKVAVKLFTMSGDDWTIVSQGITNIDGRYSSGEMTPSQSKLYKYRFEIEEHFQKQNIDAFYPFVEITFRIAPGEIKYHVPLLLNPFGYSTYRGS